MSDPVTPNASGIQPLDPAQDEVAGALLAPCTVEGTAERGRELLADARSDPDASIYGLTANGDLIAVYVLRKVKLANELTAIAVAADRRRQGHGRACLQDALRRCGRRPLAAESDDDALAFYKACGFKLVGRRKRPDGAVVYRLGWHAPGLRRLSPA